MLEGYVKAVHFATCTLNEDIGIKCCIPKTVCKYENDIYIYINWPSLPSPFNHKIHKSTSVYIYMCTP